MASLYEGGWRQGSLITHRLSATSITLVNGQIAEVPTGHDRWLLVSQDCDLDQAQDDSPVALLEIRPVLTEDPPAEVGIRSQKFKLTVTADDPRYLHALSPRTMVTALALEHIRTTGGMREVLDDERRQALRLWLGLRYDRPAVPRHLVGVMRAICDIVKKRTNRPTGRLVRNVLVQVDDAQSPPRCSLFAVVERSEDIDEVRRWLAGSARELPAALGVVDEIEVGVAAQTSLQLLESSYSADLSDLTWRSGAPDGAA